MITKAIQAWRLKVAVAKRLKLMSRRAGADGLPYNWWRSAPSVPVRGRK